MGAEVTIYGSPVLEITIYDSLMSESEKGMEAHNWKVLESMRRFSKVLKCSWVGHMSQSLEVREVGVRSLSWWKSRSPRGLDSGTARNSIQPLKC